MSFVWTIILLTAVVVIGLISGAMYESAFRKPSTEQPEIDIRYCPRCKCNVVSHTQFVRHEDGTCERWVTCNDCIAFIERVEITTDEYLREQGQA